MSCFVIFSVIIIATNSLVISHSKKARKVKNIKNFKFEKQNYKKKINSIFDYLICLLMIVIADVLFVIMRDSDYYNDYALLGVLVSNAIYVYGLVVKNNVVKITGYLSMIIVIIFFRKEVDNNYSEYYFDEWLKVIFTNKIVFLNVFGNIGLYIPLVYLLEKYNLDKHESKMYFKETSIWTIGIIVIGISIMFELIQYLLKLGIFDFMDIVLNVTGVLLLIIIQEVGEWQKRQNKQNKKKQNKKKQNKI